MYIKKIYLFLLFLSLSFTSLYGENFVKKATVKPVLVQHGEGKEWCPVCGMKLSMFYKTSHASTLKMNGRKRQYCSIRCLAVDMEEYGINEKDIRVVDAKTQKLIDVSRAYYVVKSSVPGTMSMVSKIAYRNKGDAQEHVKKYGGEIVDFKTALSMAKGSLKADRQMTRKKKEKKIYGMGKKIFKKKCSKSIDPTEYIEINELKDAMAKGLCKPLKEKQLQMAALYLWEVKRSAAMGEVEGKVEVQPHEKCPVCGMFTYKYPRWAAQIFYKSGGKEHHYSFDGVKDLIKFYFNPMRWGNYETSKRENITKILVTDYYTQKGIDGYKAYYVARSDIYGPMGHELIPFADLEDAKEFKKDHYGKKILTFSEITRELAYQLDYNE